MKKSTKKHIVTTLIPLALGFSLLDHQVSADELNGVEVENILSHLNNDELISEESLDLDAEIIDLTEVRTSSVNRTHKNGIYTVVKGDTFYSISQSFGLTQTQLRVWNNLSSIPSHLDIGTKLAVTKQGVEANLPSSQKAKLIEYGKPLTYNSAEEMIQSLAPVAVEIANQSGEEKLWPSLMLAQAIHETGVERSVGMSDKSRAPYHVLMGLKARGSVTSILDWTWEEVKVGDKTEKIQVLAEFQSFSSYPAAVQGYADRLRYGPGWDSNFYSGTWVSNSKSVWDVLDNGGLKGYATDGVYVSKIKDKINQYNLTQYDRKVSRISGETRFETAVNISKQGWDKTSTVVLANSHNFADALAGVPLAGAMKAPILLTRTGELESATLNELNRLGAQNVVILGGEQAISANVEKTLAQKVISVNRLAGETRYQTAGLIAKELNRQSPGVKEAVIVSGDNFVDAMSVASFAAQNNRPIYLTRQDRLTDDIKEATKTIKNWQIIGGSSVVQASTEAELQKLGASATRISGSDRYETNQNVIKYYGTSNSQVYVSTGRDYIDALTGAVLAAQKNTGIMLTENRQDILNRNIQFVSRQNINQFNFLGGEKVLPNKIADSLKNYSTKGQ
ncbi:cell wall-binding repeat-containing protein [Marinilactibacillus sp. Marseille-P9653]|uniref:cell wall-binding repeat-containing protein n=1 Tax=Marinilactibacillus sp. Marseille-P9653 TaxID=2866583 RepID=UPI001CE45078|nr:cell wall-binding repeat-containing protein [Marinilactibacillus sp. Marseille-P9653]